MTTDLKFTDGAFKFINDISNSVGSDLIYSLALEGGNLFFMVTAHPSRTNKRFETDSGRIMFIIHEDEYDLPQHELVNNLITKITEQIKYEPNILPEMPL